MNYAIPFLILSPLIHSETCEICPRFPFLQHTQCRFSEDVRGDGGGGVRVVYCKGGLIPLALLYNGLSATNTPINPSQALNFKTSLSLHISILQKCVWNLLSREQFFFSFPILLKSKVFRKSLGWRVLIDF